VEGRLRKCVPVTPAMVSGCAPRTEKMKAAMKEERSTSATPYCWVVSIKSREKAIPGRTLRPGQRFRELIKADSVLGEEDKSGGWYDTIIPSVGPVAEIPGSSGTNVCDDSPAPAAVESFWFLFGGAEGGRGSAGV
jgi:hypothetical protein